ncbi:hypothetical protein K492DRAFT_199799 [Lichtheimia hyalospora FSU 10163]|nr:hypothetical protein K492DRAFT_199799 [Lichtheimia hyalospora FSU 10163]
MQHSIDTGTLASEINAMGLTNTNVAHDEHGMELASSLSTTRGYHGDNVIQGTQENSERRIDFISELPAELTITKLIPMFMDNDRLDSSVPCPYLHVSKLWRDRIIQCFGGLRFSIYQEQEDHKDQRCTELVQFAQHTMALSIHYYEEWMSDLWRDNTFCSLQEISIASMPKEHSQSFVSSLMSINALTHLSLQFGSISIADLALTCPNLESLVIPEDAHLSALPVTPYPSMTKLLLRIAPNAITNDQVMGICKTLPSLRHLQLMPCADLQSAFIISEYYPFMKSLEVWTYHKGVALTFSDQGHPCDKQGITDLVLRSISRHQDVSKSIFSLIQQHQETLVNIQWGLKLESDENDLYDIPLPRLKKLSFGYSACRIPWNAPMLQELTIPPNAISNYPAVLDTVPPHMKKLCLYVYPALHFTDTKIIGQYFQRIGRQVNVRLNELFLHIVHYMEKVDNVLGFIGNLHHLERLWISCWQLDVYRVKGFSESLTQGCTELKSLMFNCMFAPSSDFIDTLKRLEHLKELVFSIEGASQDLWHSIQALSQLQRIEIYPASAVNISDIRYLEQHRPDIQVIIYKYSPSFDRV